MSDTREVIVYSTDRIEFFDKIGGAAYADPAKFTAPLTAYKAVWTLDEAIGAAYSAAGVTAYATKGPVIRITEELDEAGDTSIGDICSEGICTEG